MQESRRFVLFLTAVVVAGCALEPADGIDEPGIVPGGKADGTDYSRCELDAIVGFLNDGPSADELRAAGVHSRASTNLAAHRDGADGVFGTEDDALFESAADVDRVSWVGPVAFRQLAEAIADRCAFTPPGEPEAIFSPQPYDASHITRVVEAIDRAETSIDIAMYSFRDSQIMSALQAAMERDVVVRFLFESANGHRSSPDGSVSAQLEELGIEVRYINKIMHHKFAIVDGARFDLADAANGTLITGSGNWSRSAATRYDENTFVIEGSVELNLRYQREFNHLWEWSRPFVWNEDIVDIPGVEITDADIPNDPSVDAVFTSDNFSTSVSSRYGPTFSVIRGENTVADRWVELILNAESSIRIASGHLRSRPIAEALTQAVANNPSLDVRIYLDGQEYISAYTHELQEDELVECLEAAGTSESRSQDCLDRGFLFSYAMHTAGIATRFKYYAYRWNYSYADQMHHKYMIVDDAILITGSYNLSDNAEHNTMENDVILSGAAFQSIVDEYIDNFDAMWVTGEEEALYDSLMNEIETATGDFPIVFDSMALDWEQVTALKRLIRDECPDINSEEYRRNAAAHRYCER